MASPAPPTPEKLSLLEMRGVFRTRAEQDKYISDGWERMQVVLRILTGLKDQGVRQVLELGSNPYVMTLLMKRHFDFDLSLANYFGDDVTESAGSHAVEVDGEHLDLPYRHFNIERDAFPYADDSFDCVLFCEILEHLLINPDRVLTEIARVTRPGGFVIVSTPNATRISNLYFLAQGQSIWEGYSENGPYGRHNREFTLAEVCELVERHDFDIVSAEARNIQHLARRYTYLQWLRPTVWNEHLFVTGRRRTGVPSPVTRM